MFTPIDMTAEIKHRFKMAKATDQLCNSPTKISRPIMAA